MFVREPLLALILSLAIASSQMPRAADSITVTLTPASDTTIISGGGTNPQGDQTILSGTRGQNSGGTMDRGLLRFDLSSVPTNAAIQSVVLHLTVVQTPQVPVESNFGLYRALKKWDETADWDNARTGVPWGQSGGQETIDYAGNASANQQIGSTGEYDYGPGDALTADVQLWLANPASNFGWFLISDQEASFNTARHFGSSKSSSPPELDITYAVAKTNQPPTLRNPIVQQNRFIFSFNPTPGQAYRIEASTNLSLGGWATVTNLPASNSTNSITVTNANVAGARSKFFRLAEQ